MIEFFTVGRSVNIWVISRLEPNSHRLIYIVGKYRRKLSVHHAVNSADNINVTLNEVNEIYAFILQKKTF